MFPLASLTKHYWAVAAMQLSEANRLDFDSALADIVYTFPDKHVRVRDVFQHTSGLGNDRDGEDDVQYSDVELAFPPGTWWQYSNRGSLVARRVVEQVSGQPWAAYLREHVVAPLGLHATTICDDTWTGETRETLHRVQFVCATAADVVRFLRGEDRLIGARGIARLRERVTIPGIGALDYGLFTRPLDLGEHHGFGHTGSWDSGISVAAVRFPAEDLAIVVLAHAKRGKAAAVLLDKLARAELGVPAPEPRRDTPPPELLAELAGDYTAGDATGTLSVRDGKPYLIVRAGDRVLEEGVQAWYGGRWFGGPEPDEYVRFVPGTGPVRAVAVGGPFLLDSLARRVEPK